MSSKRNKKSPFLHFDRSASSMNSGSQHPQQQYNSGQQTSEITSFTCGRSLLNWICCNQIRWKQRQKNPVSPAAGPSLAPSAVGFDDTNVMPQELPPVRILSPITIVPMSTYNASSLAPPRGPTSPARSVFAAQALNSQATQDPQASQTNGHLPYAGNPTARNSDPTASHENPLPKTSPSPQPVSTTVIDSQSPHSGASPHDPSFATTSATIDTSTPPKSIWEQTIEITQKRLAENKLPPLDDPNTHQQKSAQEAVRLIYQDLENAAQDKQERRKRFAEKWGGFLKTGDKYAKIVDVAIQHRPEVTSLVWAGVRAILQVALDYVEATEWLGKTMECIIEKFVLCEFYATIYEEMMNSQGPWDSSRSLSAENRIKLLNTLKLALPSFYSAIIVFSVKAKQFFLGKLSFKTVLTFDTEVKPFIDAIYEEENNVRRCADLATMEKLKENSNRLREMDDYLRSDLKQLLQETYTLTRRILDGMDKKFDTNTRELLKTLSILEPLKRHCDIRSKRLPDTGTWLLEHENFRRWYSDANTQNTATQANSRILFCHGMPGAGKTTLSSLVIDHLILQSRTMPKVGIVCLYSDYQDQGNQTLVNILGTWLHQILTSSAFPDIPAEIRQTLQNIEDRKKKIELTEAKSMLKIVLQHLDCLHICLDALDELTEMTREDLLRFLKTELNIKRTRVLIFLTAQSRIQKTVVRFLELDSSRVIEIIASEDDIRKFVGHQIQEDAGFRPNEMTPTLENEILSEVVRRSQGMFLLPALHIKMILSEKTKGRRRDALQKLPGDLYKSFGRIVERLQETGDHGKLAMRVLMWLHFATRPLKLTELQHAMAVTEGDTEFSTDNIPSSEMLLESCFSLIVIDEKTQTVRFVHNSLEVYFVSEGSKYFPHGYNCVAKLCLTYLCFKELRQHCETPEDLMAKLRNFPFLAYAALHWGDYARKQFDSDLRGLALKLLKSQQSLPFCALQIVPNIAQNHRSPQDRTSPKKILGVHVAAYFGLVELLLLLGREQGLGSPDDWGRTPLTWAASRGHKEAVRVLLARKDIDVNAGGALDEAVEKGQKDIVELLLTRNDIHVNVKNSKGITALSSAAKNRQKGIVKLLLARDDIDVNVKDPDGHTALFIAALRGHRGIVQQLLAHNDTEINGITPDKCETALLSAARNGHIDIVKLLLDREDIDINKEDHEGKTALSAAASNGHKDIVKLLLPIHNIDISEESLFKAARSGDTGIMQILLGLNEIDVNSEDYNGYTALSVAASSGYMDIVQVLLTRKNIDINASSFGYTPLWCAADKGKKNILEVLLARTDIDVNAGLPLCAAAQNGHKDIVKLLLAKPEININETMEGFSDKETALSFAAEGGHTEIVKLLLEKDDIDVNISQPLRAAVREGHKHIVQLLLAREEIDVNAGLEENDHEGGTALSMAASKGFKGIVKLLLARNDIDVNAGQPLSAAAENGHKGIVKLLLARDDINVHAGYPLRVAESRGHQDIVQLLRERTNNVTKHS